MTTPPTHTPTPWLMNAENAYHIVDGEGYTIADIARAKDAAHLARCVNEREELLAGLRDMVDLLESQKGVNKFADTAADVGRDLLARAREEG